MRRFIVTNPNLSVGRIGDIVTADQLKMSDDKLDDWVGAGLGIEVDEAPTRASTSGRVEPEGETTTIVSTLNGDDYDDIWDEDDDDDED